MKNSFLNYLKSNDPEKVVSRSGVKFGKFIFPLMRLILIIANPYKLHIVRKAEIPKDKPVIYASTHGFKDDILNAVILVNKPIYMLLGALEHFYNSVEGLLAWLIGVVLVDRGDKDSRIASIPKLKQALSFGTSVIIYPEGAWNLTDSSPVMKLYYGVYRLAKSTNVPIVPIATHVEGKTCYAILGEPFDISEYEYEKGIEILRDKLATLKYEIMEKYSRYYRNELEAGGKTLKEAWEETKRRLINEAHYSMGEQELYSLYRYIDINITEQAEAFAHLRDIVITRHNAFLLRADRLECQYNLSR